MNSSIKLIVFVLILTLNFSCFEKRASDKETNKSELVAASKANTLKFTSGIRAIFQDSKGNYWIGSHDEGVSIYNGVSFEYFTSHEGLLDNQVRSIQEDKNGKIWIGTAKGASVYDNGTFTTYSTNSNNPRDKWNDTNGDLWFYAGEEDGINRFDGINMNYLVFPKSQNENPDNTYGVTDISKAQDGKVWIATYSALFNYDGKKVSVFDHKALKIKANELLHIRSVLADSKGRIWIGNNGIGVLLMEGNSIINFSEKHNLIDPTSTRRGDKSKPGTLEHVFAIEEDSEGNIWFGDRDTEAWKYDGKTLTNYSITDKLSNPTNYSVSDKASKSMIWTIYKDHKNNLLLGMENGNIFKFNGKTFEKQF